MLGKLGNGTWRLKTGKKTNKKPRILVAERGRFSEQIFQRPSSPSRSSSIPSPQSLIPRQHPTSVDARHCDAIMQQQYGITAECRPRIFGVGDFLSHERSRFFSSSTPANDICAFGPRLQYQPLVYRLAPDTPNFVVNQRRHAALELYY